MAITGPQAGLSIGSPITDGRVTVRGYSKDWRIDKEWWGRGAEYIEPLKAIGPVGCYTPVMMLPAMWNKAAGYNDAWRTTYVEGSWGTDFFEFGDGNLYTQGTDAVADYTGVIMSSIDSYSPPCMLSLVRFPAPPGQGVPVCVSLQTYCQYKVGETWEDGEACFVFPLITADSSATQYDTPFLAAIEGTGATWDPLVEGNCLMRFGQSSAMSQKETYEQWIIEYEEDSELYSGGHILVRNASNMEQYYHFHHPDFKLVSGNVQISVSGAITYVNVSPILYGLYGCVAGPTYRSMIHMPVVSTHTWEDTSDFGVIASDVTGWTCEIVNNPNIEAGYYSPQVTFTKTTNSHNRPILWYAYQDNAPTVAGAVAGMTPLTGLITSLRYTLRDDWRGASGEATLLTTGNTECATLLPGSKVEVTMGQQTGADADLVADVIATAYITPDGIKRSVNGDYTGAPQLSLEFADFVQTRLSRTCIVDMRQAGGQTVGEWASNCALRLGIPASMLDVDATIANTVIPLSSIPSDPAMVAEDGMGYAAHFDDVCNMLNIRWGVDKDADGKLFFDAGRPVYSSGVSTISYTINDTTMTSDDIIESVEKTSIFEKQRNAVKAKSVDAYHYDYYYMLDDSLMAAGEGHDYFNVVKGEQKQSVENLAIAAAYEFATGRQVMLKWLGPIRRSLRPDMFVLVESLSGLDVPAGSVWQITEHEMFCGQGLDHSSTITMALVYTPPAEPS